MTNLDPQVAFPVDISGGSVHGQQPSAPAPYRYRTFDLPATDPDHGKARGYEYIVDDLRGGYEQHALFARETYAKTEGGFRGTSKAIGVNLSYKNHLLLSFKSKQMTFAVNIGAVPLCWTKFNDGTYDRLCMASYTGTGAKLLTETSPTDATPVDLTWASPAGGIVSSLGVTHMNYPTTTGEQIVVGLHNNSPRVLSDMATPPTAFGTMHANLADLTGIAHSPLNATTPGTGVTVFYAGASLWTLPITAAVGTAPTQTLTNLNPGGYTIGNGQPVELLKSSLGLRHLWFIPNRGDGTYYAQGVTVASGRVLHTNMVGGDPLYIDFDMAVSKVVVWQKMLIATDGGRVVSYDGDGFQDWDFLGMREQDSDFKYYVLDFVVTPEDLYILVLKTDGSASNNATSLVITVEKWDETFKTFLPVSEQFNNGDAPASSTGNGPNYFLPIASGPKGQWAVGSLPSIPWSPLTGYMHVRMQPSTSADFWDRMFIAPPGSVPSYRYSQTGGSAGYSQTWASGAAAGGTQTSYWRSPRWRFPEAEGRPLKVEQVVFMGQCPVNTQVGVQFISDTGQASSEITFNSGFDNVSQPAYTFDDTLYDELQMQINLRQINGSTTRTPNGIPMMVRGRYYLTDPGSDLGLPGGV